MSLNNTPSQGRNYLAFDVGATSGRAIIGTISDGRISTEEVYRFPNQTLEIGGKY